MDANENYRRWVMAVAGFEQDAAVALADAIFSELETGTSPDWSSAEEATFLEFRANPVVDEVRGKVLHNEIWRSRRGN